MHAKNQENAEKKSENTPRHLPPPFITGEGDPMCQWFQKDEWTELNQIWAGYRPQDFKIQI